MLLPFLLLLLLLLLLFLYLQLKLSRNNHKLNLPPSPPMIPIIGNLHQLLSRGTLLHRTLQALSNNYGPLMFLRFGHSPTLVVSSAEIIKEIIKTHDAVFANRPETTPANFLLYRCKDIAFAPYGEYWRQARKACVVGLLSNKKVQSFQYIREEEVAIMINKIRSSCFNNNEGSVNLTEMILAVSNNIVSRSALGRRAEDEDEEEEEEGEENSGKSNNNFGELSRRIMMQLASFSIRDMFPYLGWLDVVSGLIGRLKTSARQVDSLFDRVIEEQQRISAASEDDDDDQSDKKYLVHTLLKFQKDGRPGIQITQDNLKALLLVSLSFSFSLSFSDIINLTFKTSNDT